MPSRAVDEAWHGLILCTARYSVFCKKAYGEFLHHHPDGGAPADVPGATDPVDEQLRRTVIAWTLVAQPGELCVLWDLDARVGVDQPWGLDLDRVAEIEAAVTRLTAGGKIRDATTSPRGCRYCCCFIASSISSMLTSRTGCPSDQWWPNGSRTTP